MNARKVRGTPRNRSGAGQTVGTRVRALLMTVALVLSNALGTLFPILFVTVACGAVSGFHSLVSSETASKQVERESDMLPISYGAMLVESLLGIIALVAVGAVAVNGVIPSGTPQVIFSQAVSGFLAGIGIPKDISFTLICLKRSREELKERIGLRVEQMFSEGLYDEIRSLARSGADLSWPAVEGIGYREFFQARIDGEESLSMIKERIIRDSLRYAKQQMTFASSMKDFVFIDPDDAASALNQLSLNGICL